MNRTARGRHSNSNPAVRGRSADGPRMRLGIGDRISAAGCGIVGFGLDQPRPVSFIGTVRKRSADVGADVYGIIGTVRMHSADVGADAGGPIMGGQNRRYWLRPAEHPFESQARMACSNLRFECRVRMPCAGAFAFSESASASEGVARLLREALAPEGSGARCTRSTMAFEHEMRTWSSQHKVQT